MGTSPSEEVQEGSTDVKDNDFRSVECSASGTPPTKLLAN